MIVLLLKYCKGKGYEKGISTSLDKVNNNNEDNIISPNDILIKIKGEVKIRKTEFLNKKKC